MSQKTVIRFGCSVELPAEGKFLLRDLFDEDPEKFLQLWIEGAVSTIYSGPMFNKTDPHDGRLLILPKVKVKFLPHDRPTHTR